MKIIVVQTGARRGYAVPAMLNEGGVLEFFNTDIAGNHGMGRLLALGARLPGFGSRLARLANRKIPEKLLSRTRTFSGPALAVILRRMLARPDPAAAFKHHLDSTDRWGRQMIRRGYGRATHLYTMLGEGGPFIIEARRRGLTIIADVYILLSTERILAEERERFPGWDAQQINHDEIRRLHQKADVLIDHTDFYLCPSTAVQQDLIDHWGIHPAKTKLVPYGTDPRWLDLQPAPVPGRILFVGTADLRKGIHYLALAAEELNRRGRSYQFRVAGSASPQIQQQPCCRHLTFLGRIPRAQIHSEYQSADLLVLPSLAEGSAQVTFEAMAAGIPLVTTAAAGSVARDGIEGRIVAERDPLALADAIEHIIENRPLRDTMATAARDRARHFTWDHYAERLLLALTSLRES